MREDQIKEKSFHLRGESCRALAPWLRRPSLIATCLISDGGTPKVGPSKTTIVVWQVCWSQTVQRRPALWIVTRNKLEASVDGQRVEWYCMYGPLQSMFWERVLDTTTKWLPWKVRLFIKSLSQRAIKAGRSPNQTSFYGGGNYFQMGCPCRPKGDASRIFCRKDWLFPLGKKQVPGNTPMVLMGAIPRLAVDLVISGYLPASSLALVFSVPVLAGSKDLCLAQPELCMKNVLESTGKIPSVYLLLGGAFILEWVKVVAISI